MLLSPTVIKSNHEDPFDDVIKQFIEGDFTNIAMDSSSLLEALTKAFVSTNQIRFGPSPNPESLVAIRQVIAESIEKKVPIPVLSPWGGRKTMAGYSVDVAELSALKQLACLHSRVKAIYGPGIAVNIRIEDVGALHLYQDESSQMLAVESVENYTRDMEALVNVLNLRFINTIPESKLMSSSDYMKLAKEVAGPMLEYLAATDIHGLEGYENLESYKELAALGWRGSIPVAQRDFYRKRYLAHDESLSHGDTTRKLAEYLAGVIARRKLKGIGDDPAWRGRFLKVYFATPVPGVPRDLELRTLWYRTVPEKLSRTHIPPWRARGYLRINNTEAIPKLASWHEELNLTRHSNILERGSVGIDIRTDYLLE